MNENRMKNDDFEGKVEVAVKQLYSQKSQDYWFDLKGPEDQDE